MAFILLPNGSIADDANGGLLPSGAVLVVAAAGGGSTYSDSVIEAATSSSSQDATISSGGSTYSASATESATATESSNATITGVGTITIPPVADWGNGVVKKGETFQADVYNKTTRALVVSKPGLVTNATTGAGTISDALLVAGTTYRVVTEFADGSLGVWDYTAA